MANPTMGYARKVGIGATSTVDQQLQFMSCGIGKNQTHLQDDAMRGYRGRPAVSTVEGTYTVGGNLDLEPRPDELVVLLPWILGGNASGTTFPLAETVPERYLTIDKGADIYTYAGCKVNRATFRSSAGNQKLTLSLDVQGTTETGGESFPSIGATLTQLQPYLHHQLVATIGGTAYKLDNFELSIDNALMLDRFFNSQTRINLPEQDRLVTISADFPFRSDESSLYGIAVGGVAATWVYTNGAYSITFTTPKVTAPVEPVVIQNRNGEVVRRINFTARKTDDSTAELTVTNDSTP